MRIRLISSRNATSSTQCTTFSVVSLVLRHLAVTRFRKWRAWLQDAISHQNSRSENGHGANWMTLPHFRCPNAPERRCQMFARHWVNLKCSSAVLALFLRSDCVLIRLGRRFADRATDLWCGASATLMSSSSDALPLAHDPYQRFHTNQALLARYPAEAVHQITVSHHHTGAPGCLSMPTHNRRLFQEYG